MKIFFNSNFAIAILFIAAGVSGCKKDKGSDPTNLAPLTASIDGTNYKVTESSLSAVKYTDAGDPRVSLEVTAALDNTGSKLVFFLNDLTPGTVSLAPKAGTSLNPKREPIAQVKDVVNQYYVKYTSGANTYYAFKGTIEVKIVENVLTYTWNITFKDASGKEFPSAGSFTLNLSNSQVKPKSAITDPTPVSTKPAIENISPNAGPAGTEVTITGVNYSTVLTENVVKFNGTDAQVKSATATKLVVTAPNGGSTGPVTLSVKGGASLTGPTFTYQQPATILMVSPAAGKAGDDITILGTGFSAIAAENVVKFNGTTATVKSAIAGSLTVTVPAGATTGPVSLSVNGATTITGPQFTVNTAGTGSGVEYINVMSGTAQFSKIATANDEIKDIYVDRATNILYYSDYNNLSPAAGNTVYRMPAAGGTPVKFSNDARITNIAFITSVPAGDPKGNIFLLKYQDNSIQKVTIYQATSDGATITEIKKDIPMYGDGAKRLYVDSQGTIWLGHSDRLNTTTGNFVYESSHSANSAVDGPLAIGDKIFVANYTNTNVVFKPLNLVTGANSTADFDLQSMFKQDDAKVDDSDKRLVTYAADAAENVYVLYPLSYQTGQLTQTWIIRKTKNGSGTSSLVAKFNTKYSSSPNYIEPQGLLSTKPVFTADALGNLYLRYNSKDIVKITP